MDTPVLRMTATTDRAGSSCGPAERLAHLQADAPPSVGRSAVAAHLRRPCAPETTPDSAASDRDSIPVTESQPQSHLPSHPESHAILRKPLVPLTERPRAIHQRGRGQGRGKAWSDPRKPDGLRAQLVFLRHTCRAGSLQASSIPSGRNCRPAPAHVAATRTRCGSKHAPSRSIAQATLSSRSATERRARACPWPRARSA